MATGAKVSAGAGIITVEAPLLLLLIITVEAPLLLLVLLLLLIITVEAPTVAAGVVGEGERELKEVFG